MYIKKLPDVKWSQTHKTFYVPLTSKNKQELFQHLRIKNWFVDYDQLRIDRKHKVDKINSIKLPVLTEHQKLDLERFKKWLQQKRLSQNTVNTYLEVTTFFIRYCLLKSTTNYSVRLIESFNYDFIVRENKSISYQNQCINGIKKYLEYKGIEIEQLNLKRPKKEKRLPMVLSLEEVKQLLDATHNLKHKTLLSLIYSAGLRIGEAINLKVNDIDSKRMLIHIKGAKGKKDRYTLLSSSFLELLREYYKTYKPKKYLFEGQVKEQYSSTSAQKILRSAANKIELKKPITPHTLRHSYATHLLENGVGLRHIQELLGHAKPETTMIYTHVARKDLLEIASPLDIAVKQLSKKLNWNKNSYYPENKTRKSVY